MSTQQEHQEHDSEEHGALIKTPKQLIVTVVLSFVVPILIIILLVKMVTSGDQIGAGSDALGPEAVAKRLQPIAKLELVDASGPKVFKTGEQVYKAVCAGCHASGAAGAFKFGDATAWAPSIKSGLDAMVASVIKGKGAMPAKGGNPALDDVEIARAVVYMANNAGGKFEEPALPAAAPAAASPAPAAAAPAAAPMAVAAAPVTASAAAPAAAAAAPATTAVGEKLYKQACFACHAAGIAGAPKFGDKAAWAKYTETGIDTMVANAIKGKGAMPPKGGAISASDADIRASVEYMVANLK